MSTTYTKPEREAISTAWAHLIDFAERHRMSDKPQLEAALKEERREVSSPTVAKALLLRTLADACDPSGRTTGPRVDDPAELWTVRGQHRDMLAYGWHYADQLTADGVTKLARLAGFAHDDATRRELDALEGK